MCWCGRQDLNLHALRHSLLKAARIPIPPRPHVKISDTDFERRTGIGPVTFSLARRHSTGELTPRSGAETRSCTQITCSSDKRLDYLGHLGIVLMDSNPLHTGYFTKNATQLPEVLCGRWRTRTPDIFSVNEALYQLS